MAARRTIVEQLPLFLQLRRRKWTGLQTFLDESHFPRPAFFLLRALEDETVREQTLTLRQMQENLFNPYATRFPVFEQLPLLVEQGYLQQQDEEYCVTDAGRILVNESEIAARTYLQCLSTGDRSSLASLEQAFHMW